VQTETKKRGPIPGPETVRTSVMLEPDLVDWGKRKPGGLSDLMRRLLREAFEHEQMDMSR